MEPVLKLHAQETFFFIMAACKDDGLSVGIVCGILLTLLGTY